MKNAKTIQTLASVSLIGGPLSLIIGGVLLSTASLVCGIVALVSLRTDRTAAAEAEAMSENIRQTLTRQAIIGIAVSGIAVVMNAATIAMMLPNILDAMQTGDYSQLFGGGSVDDATGSADSGGAFGGSGGSGSAESSTGRSSVWG